MSAKAIFITALAATSLLASPALAQIFEGDTALISERPADQRPALMVLGSAHLANSNRDVINLEVQSVLSPAKQAEIEDVAQRLAEWAPTRIAVEVKATSQERLDQIYADYRAGRYELTANEIDQFGLRLAALLGHERVYAVDWNDTPPGDEADYDWTKPQSPPPSYSARFAALTSPEQGKALQTLLDTKSIRQWLTAINTPEFLLGMHRPYYDLALMGDEGANWVGSWQGRNLKIFSHLTYLGTSPDERVLVIYGAGHAFLLNRFATESGAFEVQNASEWLAATGLQEK